jgi:hypothetical protein
MGTETGRQYYPAKIKEERDKDNYNKYIYKGSV